MAGFAEKVKLRNKIIWPLWPPPVMKMGGERV